MVDLLDIFERDNGNRRDGAPSRKGLRGLFDRLTGALDIDGDDNDDRRRPNAATTSTQRNGSEDGRRRERDSFFDD